MYYALWGDKCTKFSKSIRQQKTWGVYHGIESTIVAQEWGRAIQSHPMRGRYKRKF